MAEVKDVPEEHRYVVEVEGARAGFLDYRVRGDKVVLIHTEVYPAYEGKGLASQLVGTVLAGVRESGRTVVPLCEYVRSYLDKHQEYADLVAKPT
jgi:uncharacterized protein